MVKVNGRDPFLGNLEAPQLTPEQEAEAVANGDRDALVRSVIPWVMKVTNDICKRRKFKDFDTAFSSALMAANKSLDTFDPEKSRFISYCSRLVRWAVENEIDRDRLLKNSFISRAIRGFGDKGDSQKSHCWFDSSCDLPPEIDMQDEFEFIREYRWLLTEAQRMTLDLVLSGMEFKHVAEQLGISRESVRNHYKSAIRNIKEALAAEGIESPFVEKA